MGNWDPITTSRPFFELAVVTTSSSCLQKGLCIWLMRLPLHVIKLHDSNQQGDCRMLLRNPPSTSPVENNSVRQHTKTHSTNSCREKDRMMSLLPAALTTLGLPLLWNKNDSWKVLPAASWLDSLCSITPSKSTPFAMQGVFTKRDSC